MFGEKHDASWRHNSAKECERRDTMCDSMLCAPPVFVPNTWAASCSTCCPTSLGASASRSTCCAKTAERALQLCSRRFSAPALSPPWLPLHRRSLPLRQVPLWPSHRSSGLAPSATGWPRSSAGGRGLPSRTKRTRPTLLLRRRSLRRNRTPRLVRRPRRNRRAASRLSLRHRPQRRRQKPSARLSTVQLLKNHSYEVELAEADAADWEDDDEDDDDDDDDDDDKGGK